MDPIKISLRPSDSFPESDFACVDIDFFTRLITWCASIPKSSHDVLSVLEEDIGEHLVEIVLLELHLDHLLWVELWHGELK